MNLQLFATHLVAAATVSLQQIIQSVAAGNGNVEVCVDLLGATLARNVTVTLTPQPGAACKFLALKHHVFGHSLCSTVLLSAGS